MALFSYCARVCWQPLFEVAIASVIGANPIDSLFVRHPDGHPKAMSIVFVSAVSSTAMDAYVSFTVDNPGKVGVVVCVLCIHGHNIAHSKFRDYPQGVRLKRGGSAKPLQRVKI